MWMLWMALVGCVPEQPPCEATCGERECGLDACGAPCGSCDGGEVCADGGVCEPGLEVIRGFVCEPGQPEVFTVSAFGGAELQTVADPDLACARHLVLADASGVVELSDAAGGYASATGALGSADSALVCTSRIHHHRHPQTVVDPTLPPVHVTDAVVVECAARTASGWTPLAPVVEPDGDWAAWVRGGMTDLGDGRWRLRYARDFTFQLLNLTPHGRPETDGMWEQTVRVTADGVIADGAPVHVGPWMVSPTVGTHGDWTPTPDEEEALSDVIDFGEGPCPPPDGCPVSAP